MTAGLAFPRVLRDLFIGGVLCLLFATALGQFQTTTQLLPYHDRVSSFCLYAPCILALISALLVIWRASAFPWWLRIYWSLCAALLFLLSLFLLMNNTAELIEGWIDFPAGQTRTFPAQIAISRAYIMTGKGRSWHVQTMPVWTDLTISETDYDWMLAHRKPGEGASREGGISSRGYFCAAVILQQAGGAFRVLHAGHQTLPVGTVKLCPNASE